MTGPIDDNVPGCVAGVQPKLLLRQQQREDGTYEYISAPPASNAHLTTYDLPIWVIEALTGQLHGPPSPFIKPFQSKVQVALERLKVLKLDDPC